MMDVRKSRGGAAAEVIDRPRAAPPRQKSTFDPGLADALATLFREERTRVAKLIEAERSHTDDRLKSASEEMANERERIAAEVIDAARAAVADDVRRLAETSAELFDQRRTSLLLGIDDLAEQVRSFSNPAELTGAKWLADPDLAGDTDTAAASLLPDAWGDVIYD